MGLQLITQLIGVGTTVVWSAGLTVAIVQVVKAITGLRMDPEDEETGLDQASHGEGAYNMES